MNRILPRLLLSSSSEAVQGNASAAHGDIRVSLGCLDEAKGTIEEGGDGREIIEVASLDHQEARVGEQPG